MIGYGFFPGGDPRDFHPDPESSTDAERAQHKADCEAWARGERPNVNDNAPHWVGDDVHVVPAGYGLGSYSFDDDDDFDDEPNDDDHGHNASCECLLCYESRTLARFRDAQR